MFRIVCIKKCEERIFCFSPRLLQNVLKVQRTFVVHKAKIEIWILCLFVFNILIAEHSITSSYHLESYTYFIYLLNQQSKFTKELINCEQNIQTG